MLEVYQARLLPDLSGWWVYALTDRADGHVFYVGQSANLLSRLRDWSYQFKEQYDPHGIYLVPCIGEPEACIRELALIDFYQPERNILGTTEKLRARVAGLNKPHGKLSRSLDQSQAAV
jgi:excinuclease UvrABC nuclease subunit